MPVLMMFIWLALLVAVPIAILRSSGKKKNKALAVVAAAALVCSSYWMGQFEGERAYFLALRSEMNPFLRELGRGLDGKKKEALTDFMLRADDIKLEPLDYVTDLKGSMKILKKEPNSRQSQRPQAAVAHLKRSAKK